MTADPVDTFLAYAVLRYDGSDGPERWARAATVLAEHDDLAASSVHVAAAVADVAALRRHLSEHPTRADSAGGPLEWPPLMYLTYARVPDPAPPQQWVEALALLLEHGADPDAGVLLGGEAPPFTALTGLFGGGEQGETAQPAHPYSAALAEQLLCAGADPNDGQALYNRMFPPSDDHLRLLFAHGLGRTESVWRSRLGERVPEPPELVRAQLGWAVSHGFDARIRLLAEHGVDLESPLTVGPGPGATALTPVHLAHRSGHRATAALLVDLGAAPDPDPEWAAVSALLAGDRATVTRSLERSPDLLPHLVQRHRSLILWAAVLDRADAIRLLADVGFDVNAYGRQDLPLEQPWETALHHAAGEGKLGVARTLLELGADPTLRDRRFSGTPLDWAHHLGRPELVDLLTRS